ncbi:hypothetical protein KC460_02985 [Candidatus Dependentiae bacterium]|nr:hypothetical protein [Candidatus Dependentiae bacterium]
MNKLKLFFISLVLFCGVSQLFGMVYDNRYIFLAQRPFTSIEGRPSHLISDLFLQTASKAIGSNEKEIPLCELFGEFDQGKMARSFSVIGKSNPFVTYGRPEWQDGTFLWIVNGKQQTQGISFVYYQSITDCLSFGATWLAMRVHTRCEFLLKENSIPMTGSEKCQLDEIRRKMLQDLGMGCNKNTQSGVGDLDFYLRFGCAWDYTAKFRHIDCGIRVGALVPTGRKKENSVPFSVPFGGDGHYGMYGAVDGEFEVKEDWKVGLLLRLSKRFRRTMERRISVKDEPYNFGLLIAPIQINPGITFVFSPYILLENLREGLGVRLQYTLLHHDNDRIRDGRLYECQAQMPSNLEEMARFSKWSSDYVTVAAFYDFGKMKLDRGFFPIVTISWDIPSLLVVADRVVKSHRIIFGIEFNF